MSTDTAVQAPPAGTYAVDPLHSTVGFVARHLIGAKVRGKFTEFSGTIVIGDTPETSSVEAEVKADSITTSQEQRDAHLKSPDFLDYENNPTLTLKSTSVTKVSDTQYKVVADLTIRGVTKSVTLDLEYLGTGPGMAPDSTVAAFEASTEIDRRDFGVSFNGTLENGSLVVGNKVKLELEVEAHKQ